MFRFTLRLATTTATPVRTAAIWRPNLDNFFFPQAQPARWYAFFFGGLAEFSPLIPRTILSQARPGLITALTASNFNG